MERRQVNDAGNYLFKDKIELKHNEVDTRRKEERNCQILFSLRKYSTFLTFGIFERKIFLLQ